MESWNDSGAEEKGVNGAGETVVEAESTCSTPLSALAKSYLSIREKAGGGEKKSERERVEEREVAKGTSGSQINIRLMSLAAGLLPPLPLMLLLREEGEIAWV